MNSLVGWFAFLCELHYACAISRGPHEESIWIKEMTLNGETQDAMVGGKELVQREWMEKKPQGAASESDSPAECCHHQTWQRAGQGTAPTGERERLAWKYNWDSADSWRLQKLGWPLQLAQVGTSAWPFIPHALISYCLGLPSKEGNSPRKLTRKGYRLAPFAAAGGISSSVLQGTSGRHSRVSTHGNISASIGLFQAGEHTHGRWVFTVDNIVYRSQRSLLNIQLLSLSLDQLKQNLRLWPIHIPTASQVIIRWALVRSNSTWGKMGRVEDMSSNLQFQKWLFYLQIERDCQWLHLPKLYLSRENE